MDYTPNFNDSRVQARIKQAIKFAQSFLREDKPQWLSTRYIDEHFGKQCNLLGKFIRSQLIICVDERYNKDRGITKKYILNKQGFEQLKQQIPGNITEENTEKFKKELEQGITYKESSDRKWHWIQSQRRQEKQAIYVASGLVHNYDIKCAAPTLLLQYSQMLDDPMDLYLPALTKYINDRKTVRIELAKQADMHEQDIKVLLNGMLQGQHLSTYRRGTVYELVDGDIAKIKFLQQNEFVAQFKEDISVMWKHISKEMYRRRYADKRGVVRTSPITSKQKSALYRRLERQVLNAVEQYLVKTNNQFVLEHDGWVTKNEIDQKELVEFVRNETGFLIGLDYMTLTAATSSIQTTA
jgi:hypothetical protein